MSELIATFSIVAYDPHKQEWGVAVQSKVLAAASVVSWAQAQAGAVATQAWANGSYGPRGLELLASGLSAKEVVDRLVDADEGKEHRQLGIVDSQGRAAAYTGPECLDWAGHVIGDGYTCQGNILVSQDTALAMATRFEATQGPLSKRLVASLTAAQEAGGDRRGRQSAGLLVVREGAGYGGHTDRYIDLRIDDHAEPIKELGRLLDMHALYFGKHEPQEWVAIEGKVLHFLQELLKETGYYQGPVEPELTGRFQASILRFHSCENFEEKYREGYLAREIYEHLRRYGLKHCPPGC